MVADQGTEGHSAGLLEDSRDRMGGNSVGPIPWHRKLHSQVAVCESSPGALLRSSDRPHPAIWQCRRGTLPISSANVLGDYVRPTPSNLLPQDSCRSSLSRAWVRRHRRIFLTTTRSRRNPTADSRQATTTSRRLVSPAGIATSPLVEVGHCCMKRAEELRRNSAK
jgi:hypothetical protein